MQLAVTRAQILLPFGFKTDLTEHARQQRFMHRVVTCCVFALLHPQFFHHQVQLPVCVAPLAHAHKRQEVLGAPLAQLGLGQCLALLFIGTPEIHQT